MFRQLLVAASLAATSLSAQAQPATEGDSDKKPDQAQSAPAAGIGATISSGIDGFLGGIRKGLQQGAAGGAGAGAEPAAPTPPPAGLPKTNVKDTALKDLFADAPPTMDRATETIVRPEKNFPRVALTPLTVPSLHGQFASSAYVAQQGAGGSVVLAKRGPVDNSKVCWTYRAKIWHSETKSTDVPDFYVCLSDYFGLERRRKEIFKTPLNSGCSHASYATSRGTEGPKPPRDFSSGDLFYIQGQGSGRGTVHQQGTSAGMAALYVIYSVMGLGDTFGSQYEACRIWIVDTKFREQDFAGGGQASLPAPDLSGLFKKK